MPRWEEIFRVQTKTNEGRKRRKHASEFCESAKVAPSTDFVSAAKDKYELESQEQLEPRLVFGTNKKSGRRQHRRRRFDDRVKDESEFTEEFERVREDFVAECKVGDGDSGCTNR